MQYIAWDRIYNKLSYCCMGDRATRKHAKDSWNGRGNENLGWNDLQMYFKVIKSGTLYADDPFFEPRTRRTCTRCPCSEWQSAFSTLRGPSPFGSRSCRQWTAPLPSRPRSSSLAESRCSRRTHESDTCGCLAGTSTSPRCRRPPCTVWVKKSPLKFCGNFSKTVGNVLTKFYCTFLSTLQYEFLFNYLQLWRSYAILSVTTQFTSCAQNVHHWPKRTLAFSDIFPKQFLFNFLNFLVHILHTYYMFPSTLDYKFLSNYLQLWRSYATLSATTQCAFQLMVDMLSI